MRIRPLEPADLPEIVDITTEAFAGAGVDYWIEQRWGRLGSTGWQDRKAVHAVADATAADGRVLVAEAGDGAVVGYVSMRLHPEARLGWIPNLAVRADHRGRGLGRRLLEEALASLKEAGMHWAKIETLAVNERGQSLYPSVGFQEVVRQIHYIKPLV